MMPITTTYLEMFAPPHRKIPPPATGIEVRHVSPASVPFYRAIYDAVGGRWNWTSRKRLTDEALAAILDDPRVEIHELLVRGVSAGFAEFDGRVPGEIELKQFGLRPEFIGQGLGRYFLNQMIHTAFSRGIRRFWLHTCTEDHPGALPNYLQAGFAIYREETHD
ncbi:MAG: GNAT family N-acetyltransferase [Planctomycetes bacterium]|nr:GNAT family N-acetyltransferase [Planctomycetota bacterium]